MKEAKGFIRDKHSNAVICVDDNALKTYKLERARLAEQQKLANEVQDLKSDLGEIKHLLAKLINTRK